jgi:hypothetical protein
MLIHIKLFMEKFKVKLNNYYVLEIKMNNLEITL